jgi:hypothetical protein
MSDLSDVSNTLVGLIAGILYPNGTAVPVSPGVGAMCRVGAGWPPDAQLTPDLAAGVVNVSIYPMNIERPVPHFMEQWILLNHIAPTVTLAVIDRSITIGGTLPTPAIAQNLAVIIGNNAFAYAVQPSDTLNTIASALATLIAAVYAGATSSGAVITLPAGTPKPSLRTGGTAMMGKEIGRQLRDFRIVIWAPTPSLRDASAKAIDPALRQTNFLTLPDGFGGRLKYVKTDIVDQQEKANLYRRDLCYSVEYPSTITQVATDVTIGVLNLVAPSTGAIIKQRIY